MLVHFILFGGVKQLFKSQNKVIIIHNLKNTPATKNPVDLTLLLAFASQWQVVLVYFYKTTI